MAAFSPGVYAYIAYILLLLFPFSSSHLDFSEKEEFTTPSLSNIIFYFTQLYAHIEPDSAVPIRYLKDFATFSFSRKIKTFSDSLFTYTQLYAMLLWNSLHQPFLFAFSRTSLQVTTLWILASTQLYASMELATSAVPIRFLKDSFALRLFYSSLCFYGTRYISRSYSLSQGLRFTTLWIAFYSALCFYGTCHISRS